MGEDRTTCTEKKPNDFIAPPCRQRHSSIISSCSEDAESESTSAGYPPSPDEEREEELEYGPGIVNKLRTRFLSISLKQNRGMRRSCSMENLLDSQDRPGRSNSTFPSEKSLGLNGVGCNGQRSNQSWGNLKRAKSMDTLLMEMSPDPQPVKELRSEMNGKQLKIIKRQDGGLNRAVPTICDEELPKPDTVKTYKRMFEPAESRRGSYCRRPPVLRASAKSCAASKANGILSSPSAKLNGAPTKNKFSAKPTSPVKAQLVPDPIPSPTKSLKKPMTNGEPAMNGKKPVMNGETIINGKKPLMNGESSRPLYNGCHVVKATPVKINSNNNNNMCNGKDVEKNLNSINRLLNKREVHFAPKTDIICNGNSNRKEILKPSEESVKQFVKSNMKNGIEAVNSKPKVPPNRPNLKSLKPPLKFEEKKGNDKIIPPKLKPCTVNGFVKSPEVDCNGLSRESNCKNDFKVQEIKSNREIKPPPESKRIDEIQTPPPENKIEEAVKLPMEIKEKAELILPPEKKQTPRIQKPTDTAVKDESQPLGNDVQKKDDRTVSLTSEPIRSDKSSNVSDKKITNGFHEVSKADSPKAAAPKKEMPDNKDVKSEIKTVKKSPASPATSMVFDFRGKDVVPHVAVLPVPFGCKAPKKRPILVDGKEVPSGNGTLTDDDDDDYVDYSVPPPSGVVFEGENVKIGRGSILSTRNKELKITFDDDVDSNTFIYPSESSLLEDSERSLSPATTTGNETIPNGQHPPKLKSNTVIGTSSVGGLSTYTPSVLRTMDNFEPGMFRPPPPSPVLPEKEDETHRNDSEEEENTEVRESTEDPDMLKPADPGLISSWSLSAGTSDLLF